MGRDVAAVPHTAACSLPAQVMLNMMADPDYHASPSVAVGNAMRKTNAQLHAHGIDDSLSGTTAVVALLKVGQRTPVPTLVLILHLTFTLDPDPQPSTCSATGPRAEYLVLPGCVSYACSDVEIHIAPARPSKSRALHASARVWSLVPEQASLRSF